MRRMDAGVLRLVFIEGLLSARSGLWRSQEVPSAVCGQVSVYSRLTARWWVHGLACRSLFFTQLVSNEPARRLCGVD